MCFFFFFISSLFFFPVLSCIFYKKEDEKSNQKISRDERTSESKSARGRTFSFGWIEKNASYKHTAFDVNLDRKQQTKNSSAREREREDLKARMTR